MPATRAQARDQISAMVRTAAIANGVARGDIFYDGKQGRKPAEDEPVVPWLRILLRHQASAKTSLTGTGGASRFTRTGTLTIQVFAVSGDGLDSENILVSALQESIEGKATSGGVLFFDVTANEIGEDGPWWNTNITARVEYDEFVIT